VVQRDEGEREVGGEEKWKSLENVVVPVVAAIEDGEVLADIEV